jgi:FMN reductase
MPEPRPEPRPEPTPSVVVVIGNPRPGSRTSAVATAVADAVRGAVDVDVDVDVRTIELADVIAVSFDGSAAQPRSPQPDAIEAVRNARLLVVATPSYKGSYTGLLKLFFDQLPHQALADITTVPVAIAGSPTHLRTTTADLIRLVTELGASVPATLELLEAELPDAGPHIARAAQQAVDHVFAFSPTT